jgi:PAS domain S-box-containing protein
MDTIPGLVWSAFPDGGVEFCNQRWLDYTGLSLEKVRGGELAEAIHPQDESDFREKWRAALAQGASFEAEARMRRADGSYRWFLIRAVPLRDAKGGIIRWYGTNADIEELKQARRDITERKRSEEQLRESEARFQVMADTAPVMIWMTGTDALCNYFNKPWLEFTGRTMEQEIGTGWIEGVHPDDVQGCFDGFLPAFHARKPFRMEYRLRRVDGEYRWVLESGIPRYTGAGEFAGYIGSNIDITERKRAEEERRDAETRFRTYVDHATDALFVHDDQRKVVDVNRQACESLGYTREELIGMTPADFDPALGVDDAFVQWMKERLQAGEVFAFETSHRRKDGTLFPVEVRVRPFWHGGQRFGLALVRDITERKRAEETLRQAQAELAHVTRVTTLGEMTASIAHEINQPLAAVVNNASACLRWLAASNLEEARQSAALIIADGHRAGEIISRIRTLTKKAPPHKDWLDINETILEVIALARSEAQKNRVSLQSQLSSELPLILGDRIQLQQVILNLIINAIEAMSGVNEGPRELQVGSAKDESQGVRVAVRDSGPGLDPDSLDHLFTAFFTTKSQGMGMGLAISRSIIEAHGGRLWATTNEDRGATFQFTLAVGLKEKGT